MTLRTRLKAVRSDAVRRFFAARPSSLVAREQRGPGDKRRNGHTTNRRLVRGACLLLAVVALSPLVAGTFASSMVPALSPFVAIATMLATRTFPAPAWLGLMVAAAALLRHRFFCRWMCPAGLCLDGASWLGRRLGRRTTRFPLLGCWIVGLTLGGALLGYPFLLWLDPLARFTGFFVFGDRGPKLGLALSVAGFLVLLMLDVLWPNVWCACVCPLGAFQDLLSSLSKLFRPMLTRITGADDPVRSNAGRQFRSMGVPPMDSGSRAGCPCHEMPLRAHCKPVLPRRVLLAAAAGVAWAGVTRPHGRTTPRPLRPPGALDERTFRGVCTRCGNCIRACPSGIVERDLGQNGLAGFMTPVLRFQKDYCREDCVRCTEACPSGALVRLSPEKKTGVRLGLPRVDMDVCLLADDRECSVCRSRCPYDAIRYVWSETDYTLTPHIDREKCTGCGACEAACPTTPRKAILVFPT